MVWNLNFQGNLPKTCLPTSWLRQQSVLGVAYGDTHASSHGMIGSCRVTDPIGHPLWVYGVGSCEACPPTGPYTAISIDIIIMALSLSKGMLWQWSRRCVYSMFKWSPQNLRPLKQHFRLEFWQVEWRPPAAIQRPPPPALEFLFDKKRA